MTRITNKDRIVNITHDLNSKDLRSLNPKERRVLDCVLKNKPIYKGILAGSRDPDFEINHLRNRLISIRKQKNPLIATPKDSLCIRILNAIGIFTQSQKLHKAAEKAWHNAHPSNQEHNDYFEEQFSKLADDENYDKILEIVQQEKAHIDEVLLEGNEIRTLESGEGISYSIKSFQKILENALQSLCEVNTSSTMEQNDLRQELANLLYDHVEKHRGSAISAMNAILPISSAEGEYFKCFAKLEKLHRQSL